MLYVRSKEACIMYAFWRLDLFTHTAHIFFVFLFSFSENTKTLIVLNCAATGQMCLSLVAFVDAKAKYEKCASHAYKNIYYYIIIIIQSVKTVERCLITNLYIKSNLHNYFR